MVKRLVLSAPFGLLLVASCSNTPAVVYREASASDRPAISTGDDSGTMRTLMDLTLSERQVLCDWSNAVVGGYGKVWSCESGLVVNQRDQQQCLSEYPACYATVEQWIACQKKIATDPCALFLYTAMECKPILKCVGYRDGGPPPPEMDATPE